MNWIFSYGTLSHPEYIQLILKRLPVFTEGILADYDLFIHPENQYLFVKPSLGRSVKGQLFEVTTDELKLIDLWEDVPLYKRETIKIKTGNTEVEAFVYTQNETEGIPYEAKFQKEHESILKDIDEFLSYLSQNDR